MVEKNLSFMFQVFISDILKRNWEQTGFLNSDEEEFTETSVESAHDVGFFKGLWLKHNFSTYETVQLINGSSVIPYVIKSKLPSDVIGTVAFAIDSDSLKNCLDVGLDKEIEKIVFKEENRPLKNNVSLVIFVYNIVSRLFSPWYTDVHCKNMNVEHTDPVLVYAQS